MRTIMFSMLVAAGIGLIGPSDASAAPVNGPAIGVAAAAGQMIDQVWYYRGYGYRPYYGYGYRPYYDYGYRPYYGYGYRPYYRPYSYYRPYYRPYYWPY